MKIKSTISLIALSAIFFFSACKDSDDDVVPASSTNPTATVQPKVEATSPANNATNVALNKVISVGFNQSMDSTSVDGNSFTIKQGSTPLSGNVSYSGKTALFTPTIALTPNTIYTATISRTVENKNGRSLISDEIWNFTTGTNASGMMPVDLGSAINYVILAKTAINNSPTSAVTGDIGISPAAASFITGFSLVAATGHATSSQISGNAYAADMDAPTPGILTTAVSDMETAYNDAADRVNPDHVEYASGNLSGKTLTPGLYKWSGTVIAPGSFSLSGSSTDVWIFQIAGDLTIGSDVNINLSGGAQVENIYWQVAGEVSLGTNSSFKGIILSKTGITFTTNAVFNGRALSQSAVILDANAISQP